MKLIETIILTSFLAAAFLFITSTNAFAQEKKISEKEVPAPVLNSFHNAYPKAVIKGTSMEKEHGKTFYEIESMDGSQRRDLLYAKDGKVAEVEETLAAKDIPDFVKNSIVKKFPKGEINRAEKVTSGDKISYELLVKSGDKKAGVVLDAKGNILKVKKMKKENEKEEKSEKDND